MRIVLQRVSRATVRAGDALLGEIGRGFVLLAGFHAADGESTLEWMADKVVNLRVFADPDGKMNLSLADVRGEILVVSQFTLYGDVRKGRRPSFVEAAPAETGRALYERFVSLLRERVARVETGDFGALMQVELVNDGPVTLILERS